MSFDLKREDYVNDYSAGSRWRLPRGKGLGETSVMILFLSKFIVFCYHLEITFLVDCALVGTKQRSAERKRKNVPAHGTNEKAKTKMVISRDTLCKG